MKTYWVMWRKDDLWKKGRWGIFAGSIDRIPYERFYTTNYWEIWAEYCQVKDMSFTNGYHFLRRRAASKSSEKSKSS